MEERGRAVLREVGILLGVVDPEAFVEAVLAPSCQHYGEWDHDDEVCPDPCGMTHEWCCACGRPMKPSCPIVEGEAND